MTNPTPHGQAPEALEDFEVRKLAAIGAVSTSSGLVERRPIEYRRELEDQFVRGFRAAEKRPSALSAAPGEPGWWRKRADEIEVQVALTGSPEAMRCYTDMRALLHAATEAAPQQEAQRPWGYAWRQSPFGWGFCSKQAYEQAAGRGEEVAKLYTAPQPKPAPLSRDQIREVFMAHGFTIKEGQPDLKQYVYDAAYALLGLVAAPQQEAQEPVAWYEYNADLDAWFLAYRRNPKAKTRPLVFGDTAPQTAPAPLSDAVEHYLESQDALDNREYAGINAESYETLIRRRNASRKDLDAALAAQGGK
jgi:hypothetical protein